MKTIAIVILLLSLAGMAAAQSLAPTAPVKAPLAAVPDSPPSARQGGDTIADAFQIPSLPFADTGTTVGYVDDYASTCYTDNGAPDVVYSLVIPAGVNSIRVSLCGSTYDTGLQILDSDLVQVACSDDFCGLQSEIESVLATAGQTYYVVVDGYSSASGSYTLDIGLPPLPCVLECPPDAALEGEPPLQNDQPNDFNDGCGGEPGGFQELPGDASGAINLCGGSGWFTSSGGQMRDTDWFTVTVGPGGVVHAEFFAEWPTYLFHLAPMDCNTVGVEQQVTSSCALVAMDVTGEPGEVIWLWTGPTTFAPPNGENPYEYDYDLNLTGLEPVVATEAASWGAIKSLYR